MKSLRLYYLIVLVLLTSACGDLSGGNDSNGTNFSPTLLERSINGFIVKSFRCYFPNNSMLWSDTYSIDKEENILTVKLSGEGQESYYYNASGQIIRYRFTNKNDPDSAGNYPKSSENYFQYNDNGLVSSRTRDLGINGQIDSNQTWSYNSSGKLTKREYDANNDGIIDIVVTYSWNSLGQKESMTETKVGDGSSTTYSYSYKDSSLLPTTRYEDRDSDGTIDVTLYYSFDDNGNPKQYSYHNRSGALIVYYMVEYESAGDELVPNLMLRNFNIYQ